MKHKLKNYTCTKLLQIVILLISVLIQPVNAQSNKADMLILKSMSKNQWFDVRYIYEQTKDSLSDYVRLKAGAMIDYNFNNPRGAVEKINKMYTDYYDSLAPEFFYIL